MRLHVVAAFAAALFTTIGCKKDSATADSGGGPGSASLEGDYLLTGLDVGGEKKDWFVTQGSEEERTVTIKGDKITINFNEKEESQTIKIDATKSPAEIDIVKTKSRSEGNKSTTYAIYKLEGGVLTICSFLADEPKPEDRPKDFTSSDKVMIMTMKKK